MNEWKMGEQIERDGRGIGVEEAMRRRREVEEEGLHVKLVVPPLVAAGHFLRIDLELLGGTSQCMASQAICVCLHGQGRSSSWGPGHGSILEIMLAMSTTLLLAKNVTWMQVCGLSLPTHICDLFAFR
jgi:hypothetical protein